MTTTVKITAHVSSDKEVLVSIPGFQDQKLQDGETTEVFVYDSRVARVEEVLKASQGSRMVDEHLHPVAQFQFGIGQRVTIETSGESGEVIGRAEYLATENQYYLRYKAADGRAVEAWWSESALS